MKRHFFKASPVAISTLAICIALGMPLDSARADDAQQQEQQAKRAIERHQAMFKRMAVQQEIAAQPQGIHKVSDGTICIKSGNGCATVHCDGRGCGTGVEGAPQPAVPDSDLMSGIFFGILGDPQQAADLGLSKDQVKKILDAYNYSDHEGTHPAPVLKLYEQYAKAPEGKARDDAEKALMEKVRAVGQAYIDSEAKRLKDVKALLTPAQIGHLREIGAKMVRPFEKPLA